MGEPAAGSNQAAEPHRAAPASAYDPSRFSWETDEYLAAQQQQTAAAEAAPLPTREEVVSTLQGRPYNEVVAERAAAAPVVRTADAAPAPATTNRADQIRAGLVRAWLDTPRFAPGRQMGLVRHDASTIVLDMAMMAENYRVEVAPGATCTERRGGTLRCRYRAQFSGGASVFGSSPLWYPWGWVDRTDDFRSVNGALRSSTMEAFVLSNYGYRPNNAPASTGPTPRDNLEYQIEQDRRTNDFINDWVNVRPN